MKSAITIGAILAIGLLLGAIVLGFMLSHGYVSRSLHARVSVAGVGLSILVHGLSIVYVFRGVRRGR